jgi:co-chaperonin GroES (HSP10)
MSSNELTIKPNGHYVLIELIEVKQVSRGGILLTDVKREQKATQCAIVKAIGPTAFIGVDGCNPMSYPPCHDNYTKTPAEIWGISVGDTVGLNRYEGADVNIAGVKNLRLIPDVQLTHIIQGEFDIDKSDF